MKYLALAFSIAVALCASRAVSQTFTTLVSFNGTVSGAFPAGDLTLAGTTLYGMTHESTGTGYGNIFSVGIDGSDYQDLYDFSGGTSGVYPSGDLTFSGGTLFGMTSETSRIGGGGTVFAFVLPTPTPEPGTMALVGTAAVALVSYRWRP